MMPTAQVDLGVVFDAAGPQGQPPVLPATDPLQQLIGTWQGTGFNAIWRPLSEGQDRLLMLSVTRETMVFSRISGAIPNRGLLQPDIGMLGLTYMDQIQDETGQALHIEPGIWAVVPATINPHEPETVVRMASIPHGTSMLAQGTVESGTGSPTIPNNDIIPFAIGGTAPPLAQAEQEFPELNLSQESQFRLQTPNVNQAMVTNPNSLLQGALAGKTVNSFTALTVTTTPTPTPGGGTANTAFLQGATPGAGNADASEVDATFWIEALAGAPDEPAIMQLQYTQQVMLDFNGQHWPHVTVATLEQTARGPFPIPWPPTS